MIVEKRTPERGGCMYNSVGESEFGITSKIVNEPHRVEEATRVRVVNEMLRILCKL